MKLALSDFWPGFQHDNNFFVDLFKKIYGDVTSVSPQDAEILIFSCFGQYHKHANKQALKIFYTGENKRPDFKYCDYSLTFDFSNYSNRNIRLPLWYLYIDWFNKGGYNSPKFIISPDKLIKNKFIDKPKTKFCCIVNSHLANDRDKLINQLSKYKKIGLYGSPFGNGFSGEDTKYNVISDYKFNICFENINSLGYHTEKLLQAKTAGCLPLYNGAKTVTNDFNKKCFINYQDFDSLEEFCDYIIEVDKNDDLYNQIKNEQLFAAPPTLDNLIRSIQNIIH